jgi:hypothetical protein
MLEDDPHVSLPHGHAGQPSAFFSLFATYEHPGPGIAHEGIGQFLGLEDVLDTEDEVDELRVVPQSASHTSGHHARGLPVTGSGMQPSGRCSAEERSIQRWQMPSPQRGADVLQSCGQLTAFSLRVTAHTPSPHPGNVEETLDDELSTVPQSAAQT